MKKIAISLLIVLFAIFAFFYIQLNQLKNSIADHLAQYDIQVNDFSLSLLPQPTVNLSGLKYHQLSAENIDAKFALFPLFSGNPILEEFQITHFKLRGTPKIPVIFSHIVSIHQRYSQVPRVYYEPQA